MMPLLREDEELFRSSTMTFGEHLEELRGALLQSVLGLIVALAVSFPFADDVVRFVEIPLKRALGKYYRAEAADEILQSSASRLSLADWNLLGQGDLVPRRVSVDLQELRQGLRALEPSTDSPEEVRSTSSARFFRGSRETSRKLARQIVAAALDSRQSPARVAWQLLSPKTQDQMRTVAQAKADALDKADPRMIVDSALRQLLESEGLIGSTTILDRLDTWPPQQRALGQSLLRAWNNEKNPNLLPHWNRLVLASEFPELLPVPSVQLAEITFWEPARSRIQSLGVPEAFMAWMKAWFVLALILACPWISYQLWLFVAAGLYGHERKMVYLCLPASIGLFLLGAAMAFAFVFDPVLDFLFSYNRKLGINIEPRFKDWIGFVLLLPIGFGVSFQLPLVMLALERIGIVTLESFISRWRIYILAIFFVSMILTPADPVSMLLMAIPLTVLYFLGILLCRNMPRSMRQPAA